MLDSNTLIMMAQGLVTPAMIDEALEYAYTPASPTAVREELARLASSHPRSLTRRLARVALQIAERLGVAWLETPGIRDADDAIEALARTLKAGGCRVVVATSDRSLRRRLRRLGVPTVYYRESEARLELDWSHI